MHVMRMVLKFIACLVVLGIILGFFFNFSFANVLLITAVLSVVGYILGDLFLLRTGNLLASAADFGLAFLVVWFMGLNMFHSGSLLAASLISAAAVMLFEYFFHRLLIRDTNTQKASQQNIMQTKPKLQMEASEELKPDLKKEERYNEP